MTATNRIGVFGGAFAPFHNGHLRLAIEAREQLGLAEVRLMPTAEPPHRPSPSVAFQRRAHWVELATRDEPGLRLDRREGRRAGPSYTVDSLAELRAECAGQALVLIPGSAAFAQFDSWERWREIAALANVAVTARLGRSPQAPAALEGVLRKARARPEFDAQDAGYWIELPTPALSISSTAIRKLLKERRSLRGLVPPAMLNDFEPQDIQALIDYD